MAKRKDLLPEGWTRQALTVPTALARAFQEYGAERGQGEIKNLGTVALALVLGMPPVVRESVTVWAIQTFRIDPSDVTPADTWRIFMAAYRSYLELAVSTRGSTLKEQDRALMQKLIRNINEELERVSADATPSEQDGLSHLMADILGVKGKIKGPKSK